jgi:two-component system chemotaxis sensor kinase CheA
MIDPELSSMFLVEAGEHLNTAEADILELESEGAATDDETINRLFRALHTIKGGAGFLELPRVKNLAHAMENIAGALREKERTPDKTISNCLLRGIDKLKLLISDITNDAVSVDAEIRDCESVMNRSVEPVAAVTSNCCAFDLATIDLSDTLAKKLYVYEFSLDLVTDLSAKKLTVRALLDELNAIGKVLATSREIENIAEIKPDSDGRFVCSFLFSSVIDDPDIITSGSFFSPLSMTTYTPAELAAVIAGPIPATPTEVVTPIAGPMPAVSPPPAIPPPIAQSVANELHDLPESQNSPVKGGAAPKSIADATVRIPVTLLDRLMNLASELVLVRNQSTQAIGGRNMQQIITNNQRLNVVTSDLQNTIMQTRMQPIGAVLNRFTRVVRDLAQKLGKEINLDIIGSDVELDKNIIEAISDPMTHLVRNSIDHGVELPDVRRAAGKNPVGKVTISAFHQAGQVNIQIVDDGKGMDPATLRQVAVRKGILTDKQAAAISDHDAFNLIFEPGFSTAEKVTEISGRGVGMDVVKTSIKRLGGLVDIDSRIGQGTTITIKLPLTLAIITALVVAVGKGRYAIPQVNIVEVVWLHGDQVFQAIKKIDNREVYWLRGTMLPLVRLSSVLQVQKSYVDPVANAEKRDRRAVGPDRRGAYAGETDNRRTGPVDRRISLANSLYIIVLNLGHEWYGLVVDTIIDTEEIVVKALHEPIKNCQVYAGMTVLGNGDIAMILDIAAVAHSGGFHPGKADNKHVSKRSGDGDRQTVLLFDIGGKERFAVPLCHITRVEEIKSSRIQWANAREYLEFRDNSIPLIRIENARPNTDAAYDTDSQFVIIPKTFRKIGVMAAHILDTLDVPSTIDHTTISSMGIIGSQLIAGHLTLFLDLFAVIEAVEPGWFDSERKARGNNRRILLVDDSAFYRSLIASFLKGAGIEVTVTDAAVKAMDILKTETFDGIVSDIEMPVMNGFDFARHLRSQERFKTLPLLAISAADEKLTRPQSLASGFNDFSSKSRLEGIFDMVMKTMQRNDAGAAL